MTKRRFQKLKKPLVYRHCHTMQFLLQLAMQFYSEGLKLVNTLFIVNLVNTRVNYVKLVNTRIITYQTFLHSSYLLRAELRCKLQEKQHRVTVS